MTIEFTVPVRTENPSNGSWGHWTKHAGKMKAQRARVSAFFPPLEIQPVFRVTITRLSFGEGLDPDDNLPASLKAVKDAIAAKLGLDDRSRLATWKYAQGPAPAKKPSVHVRIEVLR